MVNTLLGYDIHTKQPVSISSDQARKGMLVIGRTGSGKSTLLEQMAIQYIQRGSGCGIIEPSGRLINSLIPRIPSDRRKDVILLYPEDEKAFVGMNIYDCPNNQSRVMVSYTLNAVMDTFEKLYDMSRATPRMAQVMRNVALTMIYNPGYTLIDIPLLFEEKWFRDKLVRNAPTEQQRFWRRYEQMAFREKDELIASTLNKVDEFVNDPILRMIFGQSKTSLSILLCK